MTSASRFALRARLVVLYRIHGGGWVSPGHRVPKTPYFIFILLLQGPHGNSWISILGLKRQAQPAPWPPGASAAVRLVQYLASLETQRPKSTAALHAQSKKNAAPKIAIK